VLGEIRPKPPQPEHFYPPIVPGYEIYRELARSGVSLIFEALQTGCQRRVALKVLRGGEGLPSLVRDRFRGEVELLGRLDHPHIVPLYDAGESDGRPYFAMKLLAHGNLRDRMRANADQPLRSAVQLVSIAEAVHYVHRRGAVHCDLKPTNILFDGRGEPFLCDFGAARPTAARREDVEMNIVGTPAYMAPEQSELGRKLTEAVDIWALGVMLYEMLTGELPFKPDQTLETLRGAQQADPRPPRLLNPSCPAPLEELCLRCLRKDPGERPSSAADWSAELRVELTRPGGGAAPAPGQEWSRADTVFPPRHEPVSEGQDRWLHAGIDALADGVLVLTATGKVVCSNPAAERVLGRDLTGFRLLDWLSCQSWLRADAVTPCFPESLPVSPALRGRSADEVEVFLPPGEHARGSWVLVSACPLIPGEGASGAVVVFHDVTGRQASFEAGKLCESVLGLLGLNVFRKDLQGRYTFANDPFCKAVGRPLGQVLGCTDLDLLSVDLAPQVAAKEAQVYESGGVVEYVEEHKPSECQPRCRCRLFHEPRTSGGRDNEMCYFQMFLAPLHNAAQQVVGIQGAFWNITSRRRAERQLEQTADALKQANFELGRSNTDLEQFAYAASHDLTEPLRMVSSFTKLLQDRYRGRLDETADQYIHFAVDGASRMQQLIADLLAYSRVGRGQPLQEVCCAEACEGAVLFLREFIRENDAVVTCGALPRVKGDATQLMQVFQNLIGNAIKFRGRERPQVTVGARRDSSRGEWLFSVQDNGIGIEPQHLERIFAIFQRLHTYEQYPGSGIGLAICRKIIERHGGRIWAESQPGKGSSFYFTIPIA
jgi:signal transduction histidine kinase